MKAKFLDGVGDTLITLELDPKTFSTGSRGYRGQGKVTMDGKKFQVQVQAVEIGSKPAAKAK